MKFKYTGTIPVIDLKFTCHWDKNIGPDTDTFVPTFNHPIIITFEGCSPSIKLWKKGSCWNIRVIKNQIKRK